MRQETGLPAPFCLRTEVDAPLDDANVGRFSEIVKAMSERVQFLIITHNPTASVEFLTDFSEPALRNYLDHLLSAQIPRGRLARWVRPGDTPGIVMAEPRD